MTSGGEPFQARQATGSRPFDAPSGHTPCADTTNTPRGCCSTPKASGALRTVLLHVSGASFHIPSAVRRAGRTGFRSDAPIRGYDSLGRIERQQVKPLAEPHFAPDIAALRLRRMGLHKRGRAEASVGFPLRLCVNPCGRLQIRLRHGLKHPIPPLQVPAGHGKCPGKLRGAPLRAIRYQVLICSCSSSVPSSSKTMKSRMCMPTVSPMCSWRYV